MEKDKFWEFFDDETRPYAETILAAEGDYYEKAYKYISPCLRKGDRVLDIGNGGIINYDYSQLEELICADLSLSPKIVNAYKKVPNIRFIEGNILDMSGLEENSFDAVIVQKVIHHLAEKDYPTTRRNCQTAVKECIRILKPGGALVICESTVTAWFEKLEKLFFGLMFAILDLINFDRVFQYSPSSLESVIRESLGDKGAIEEVKPIGTGDYVLFIGRKTPAWILPCGVTFYLVRKR